MLAASRSATRACRHVSAKATARALSVTASRARFSAPQVKKTLRRPHTPAPPVPVQAEPPANAQADPPAQQQPAAEPSLPWTAYGSVPEAKTSAPVPFDEAATPVNVPDDPGALVLPNSPAARLLAQPALIVVRQLEMLNLFIGFEQASRFAIMGTDGTALGYLLEEQGGIGATMARNFLRTHRPFKATVMDTEGNILLRIQRPISYINSRITVTAGSDDPATVPVVGEARQVWAPLRRNYDLFIKAREGDDENAFQQFASIRAPFLAWDFDALDEEGKVCASVSRRWGGWGRELFTDTGQYVLRFDAVVDDTQLKLLASGSTDSSRATHNEHIQAADKAAAASEEDREKALVLAQERTTLGLTLDQRAVLLAFAASVDVDYFSRSRGGPGSDIMMLPFYGGFGGGGSEAGDAGTGITGGEIGNETDPNGQIGNSPFPADEDAPMPQAPPPSDQLPPGYEEQLGEQQPMQDPWGQDPGDQWAPGPSQDQPASGDSWWGGGNSGGGSSGGDSGGGFDWGDW